MKAPPARCSFFSSRFPLDLDPARGRFVHASFRVGLALRRASTILGTVQPCTESASASCLEREEKKVRISRCLLSVSVVVGALAVGASAAAAATPKTISVLEVDTVFAGTGGYNAASNAAPSVGQGVSFSGTLYKWSGSKRGAPVGHVTALCTVTAGGALAICQGAISLPSGAIELAGLTNFANGPSDVPVVGGTGAFVGAQGYMHSKPVGGSNSGESADVIHITN